jgi:expansin (peptidoglycan-binding protein)
MTWQLSACPDGGKIVYQFQTGANVYWTSLWVRDAKLPIAKVEVKSARHADWFALTRASDGTLTDAGGFGAGGFTLRVTAADGQSVSDTFPGFQPGDLLTSSAQFN